MKSIFKRKTLVALNLMLLLGMSTKGYSGEGGSISQTSANGTPINVAVTVDGGFTAPYRRMLTDVNTVVIRDVPQLITYVQDIGVPSDLATVDSLFGRHRRELDLVGTPSDLATVDSLFGRLRRELELMEGLSISVTAGGGFNEVLRQIGLIIPAITQSERNVRDDIAAIAPAITTVITGGNATLLTAIDGIAQSVDLKDTHINQILTNIGALLGFVGSPTCHQHTLFGTLHTLLEEVKSQKHLQCKMVDQLCVRDEGERYLPKALVALNDSMQHVIRLLSHSSGTCKPGLASSEGAFIIELLGSHDRTPITTKLSALAHSNFHMQKELKEIRKDAAKTQESVARVVEILEDDDKKPSSDSRSDVYEKLTETVGQFENPCDTVAGSLEAVACGLKSVATSEQVNLLTRGMVALNQKMGLLENKLDRILSLLSSVRDDEED